VGGWCGQWEGLPGRETERCGVRPAVVLGEHLAEAACPAGGGATADLAGRDRTRRVTVTGQRREPGLLIAFVVPLRRSGLAL